MRALSLVYHDVVPRGAPDESGFPGAAAASYKLDRETFARHLAAIADRLAARPATVWELLAAPTGPACCVLTFDDGGRSAITCIADLLEERDWRGHFFVTTAYVGAPGFVTAADIRSLAARGHVIGSHSHSHPTRMSQCGPLDLLTEWRCSTLILAEILGEPVRCASVPGGYYAPRVAEAAAAAGVDVLFTSEPTARCHSEAGCLVIGRYAIRRSTSARTAAAYASGQVLPRLQQQLFWNVKKVAKAMGGNVYLAVRRAAYARLRAQRDRPVHRLSP